LKNNSEKKKQLIEFLRFNKMAQINLSIHNKKTDFYPKDKENRVIIPYITHFLHVSGTGQRPMIERPNIWEMIEKLGKDKLGWKHIFWTN